VKKLWKANFTRKLQALEFLPAPERLNFAPVDLRGSFRPAEPSTTVLTALDSRALSRREQAKSVRRGSTKFTCHAQLFHKPGKCASAKKN